MKYVKTVTRYTVNKKCIHVCPCGSATVQLVCLGLI